MRQTRSASRSAASLLRLKNRLYSLSGDIASCIALTRLKSPGVAGRISIAVPSASSAYALARLLLASRPPVSLIIVTSPPDPRSARALPPAETDRLHLHAPR